MNRFGRLILVAVSSIGCVAALPALADPFTVTYENAGVQNTTSTLAYSGVETFNERPTGSGQSFTTTYGTTAASAYQLAGAYNGVQVNAADQYGGAGGTGSYATTFSSAGYSLGLTAMNTATGQAAPINYFGFWLSALDAGNQVSFYNNATLVYSFAPAQVQALLNGQGGYFGNPNAPYKGQNGGQEYVFLNFYDTLGSFNKIVFAESPQVGGYESDNQTVGYYLSQSGTNVPEPASVALFVSALAGLAFLRHRAKA